MMPINIKRNAQEKGQKKKEKIVGNIIRYTLLQVSQI